MTKMMTLEIFTNQYMKVLFITWCPHLLMRVVAGPHPLEMVYVAISSREQSVHSSLLILRRLKRYEPYPLVDGRIIA